MNNRDKSALALALAIVGGVAAGTRCDESEWVENSSQTNPRPAAYTVKAYTDPFVPRFAAAKPVWPKGMALERNLFVGFAAHFDAKEGERPLLRITGASDYRIWLNGEHVGWGPARAAKGYFRVDEIPLQVKAGLNFLAVEVAGYNVNSYCTMCQPSFLQAEVVLGDKVIAATGVDGGFSARLLPRVQKVARYSYQRAFGELYRLRPHYDDWKRRLMREEPGPMLEERPEVKLLPRRAPYAEFKVRGPFRPVSRAKTVFDAKRRTRPVRFVDGSGPNGVGAAFAKGELEENWWDLSQRYVATNRVPWKDDEAAGRIALADGDSVIFDAGLNDSGFPMLRVKCLRPGKIAFRFDEVLVDGEVSPTRYECANVVVWDLLEPGEYALEAFEPYTLRYADVVACSGAFEIDPPSLREYKNPEAFRATLESSDKALEKIFAAAQETFSQNSADVFTDCPGRERAGWLCDSFFLGRSAELFTGSLESERLFLENYVLPDCFDNLPRGMFAMCYPADFPNGNFIPNWAMWLALEVEEYRDRGGDPALVAAYRPRLEALVAYLKGFRNSDGLLEKLPRWVFVEWSRANSLVQDVSYPSNMLWARMLEAMDRLYSMPELAAEAAKVREAVRRQSWTGEWFCDNAMRQKDGSLKLSGECTETCQYYAFFFGIATKETHPELWKRLVEDFGPKRAKTGKFPKIHPSNAFIGNYLRLECLSREGLSAQILEETRGFFLYMAEITGTLWEHIRTEASCNHGFASHIAVTCRRDLLGLRKMDYAAKTLVFDPPRDLPVESLSMTLPVGGGEFVRAGWRKTPSGELVEELSMPASWRRTEFGSDAKCNHSVKMNPAEYTAEHAGFAALNAKMYAP